MSESNTFIFIVIDVKHYVVVVSFCLCSVFSTLRKTNKR